MEIRIDTHHHAVPPFYVKVMEDAGVKRASGLAFPRWNPARSLRMMNAAGIRRAVLSLSTPGVEPAADPAELARRVNEYFADICSSRPDRFGAFGAVPQGDGDAAAREATRVLDDLGLDGVTLLSNNNGEYLDAPRFRDLLAELDRREAWVFIHPTDPADSAYEGLVKGFYGWFVDTARTVYRMEEGGIFEQFPRVKYLISHGGGALPLIREIVKRRSQLRCDTAKVADPIPLEEVRAAFGPDRITYGSDFPWSTKARYWKSLIEKNWKDRRELLEAVFMQNPEHAFGAPAKEHAS